MNKKDSFITLPKWHRLLLKGMVVGIVCFFSFAVLLYLLYNPGEDFDKALYIKSFIITPTLMQVAVVFIFGFTVKFLENRLSNLSMTIILLICFNMYLGIMVGVHNSVPEMAVLLIYPIFGATIYNSRTVVIFQGILSTAVYIFIKSVIVPQSTFFIPINTNRTYYIIFIGLTIGAMTISLLLKRVSTAIVNNSIQEKKILELAVKTDQMTGLSITGHFTKP